MCFKKNLSKLVNFCVAILILKTDENTQHIRLSYFKNDKIATEMKKKICTVYGEGTVTDQMCQKWFEKFHATDFLLDDAPQSGGPVEVDSDQIKTLIESNKCYITWDIADILKISKSIMLLVKM